MKSDTIQQWWPLGQSLDLVRGDTRAVAAAVETEVKRFVEPDPLTVTEIDFDGLAGIFGSVPVFTNFPTSFFVLPSHSEWTVLWNNSFLCDGYDSLCYCLTVNHALDTLHWDSHDDDTTSQAGSAFTFRSQRDGALVERNVYVGNNDGTWSFYASGPPLPEEDLALYGVRRKRDRLNEKLLMELLSRLGAEPWSDTWYDVASACYKLTRSKYPDTIIERPARDVVTGGGV